MGLAGVWLLRRLCFRLASLRRIVVLGWLAGAAACGQATDSDTPREAEGGQPISCARTPDCRGGEFCDRGVCSTLATYDYYGHGYGAQCVGEEFYPSDISGSLRGLHCRSYVCMDGHCSSCASDAECKENYVCAPAPRYPQYPDRPPDFPGRRCTLRAVVEEPPVPCGVPENPVPCGPTKPEISGPPLVTNPKDECRKVEDCRGDEFCDRGGCSAITVDPNGLGYGAAVIQREPPNLGDICIGFLNIGHWCGACLADSECYPEAPYCIHHPMRPEARSCAPHPESEYYDASGKVAPTFSMISETPEEWLEDYRAFRQYHEHYRAARAEVGLPVPPPLPAIAPAP